MLFNTLSDGLLIHHPDPTDRADRPACMPPPDRPVRRSPADHHARTTPLTRTRPVPPTHLNTPARMPSSDLRVVLLLFYARSIILRLF